MLFFLTFEIYSSIRIEVLCLVIYCVWNITFTINRTIDYFLFGLLTCIFILVFSCEIKTYFSCLYLFIFIFCLFPFFSPMILNIELWNIYVCIYNIKIINYNLIGKTGKCKRNSLSVFCRMQNLFLFIYLNLQEVKE